MARWGPYQFARRGTCISGRGRKGAFGEAGGFTSWHSRQAAHHRRTFSWMPGQKKRAIRRFSVVACPRCPAIGLQWAAWKSISRRLLGTNNWVVSCFDWASWVTRYKPIFQNRIGRGPCGLERPAVNERTCSTHFSGTRPETAPGGNHHAPWGSTSRSRSDPPVPPQRAPAQPPPSARPPPARFLFPRRHPHTKLPIKLLKEGQLVPKISGCRRWGLTATSTLWFCPRNWMAKTHYWIFRHVPRAHTSPRTMQLISNASGLN